MTSMEMKTEQNNMVSGTICVVLSLKSTYSMLSCFKFAYSPDSVKVQIQDHMHVGRFSAIEK